MKRIDNVLLIGVGAMGSFLAPRLYESLGDEHFHVVAGGERKRWLEEQGLNINGAICKFPVLEPGTPGHAADLIIIGVKSTGLDQALEDISAFVGPDTVILPVLNGVDSEERVGAKYGNANVLHALMRVSVVMKDGCCTYDPDLGRILFGEKVNEVHSDRVNAVEDIFVRAGIPYEIPADMLYAQWFKYACNVGENLSCALLGVPFGAFTRSDHVNYIRKTAMREVIAIAQKLGVALGEEEVAQQSITLGSIPFENKPSTLQDLEAGRKTEIDMFAGEVVRLGERLDVATPMAALLDHAIRALEEKNGGLFIQ